MFVVLEVAQPLERGLGLLGRAKRGSKREKPQSVKGKQGIRLFVQCRGGARDECSVLGNCQRDAQRWSCCGLF